MCCCPWGHKELDKTERLNNRNVICASQVLLVVKNPPANAGDTRDTGLIPGSRRSREKEMANPLQDPCLEKPRGRRSLAGYMGSQRVDQDLAADHTHTQLIFNVVLVFSVQRSVSVIHTYTDTHMCIFFFFIIFSVMACHRMLDIVPCGVK